VERLKEVAKDSNVVCICGCPMNEHENYGEDGLGCENPHHECIPTSHAVLNIAQDLRAEVERLRELPPKLALKHWRKRAVKAEAEVERLKEENKSLTKDIWERACTKRLQEALDRLAAHEKAIRPEVRKFAEAMEEVLKENDHKGGWDDVDPGELSEKLAEEVREVQDEIARFREWGSTTFMGLEGGNRRALERELIDVANVCMMLCENLEVE
jgi:NTP pyrophosphatase (non-canonical NTP hydrolase)